MTRDSPFALFGRGQFGGYMGRLALSQGIVLAIAAVLSTWRTTGAPWLIFAAALLSLVTMILLARLVRAFVQGPCAHLPRPTRAAPEGLRELAAKPRGSTHMTHEQSGQAIAVEVPQEHLPRLGVHDGRRQVGCGNEHAVIAAQDAERPTLPDSRDLGATVALAPRVASHLRRAEAKAGP